MAKVIICEKVGSGASKLLNQSGVEVVDGSAWDREELQENLRDADGMLVRSATQVDQELIGKAEGLKVVGRAGVGVDNIDVEAATRAGVTVVNAPESNVITAAEHTVALLTALSRNIPQANQSLKEGRWERGKFGGVELAGKTLGIMGFGRIGQLVAERARALQMKIVAYDPYVSEDRFQEMGAQKADELADIYKQADFITLHLPSTPETKEILDKEAFAQMKPGVRILNVARGALVNEDDLLTALEEGRVAGAALDVFQEEPPRDFRLISHPQVIATPHLGASTEEANDRAGVQAAEQIIKVLAGEQPDHPINLPSLPEREMQKLKPLLPLAEQLGSFAAGVAGKAGKLKVSYQGSVADIDQRPLTYALLSGYLKVHSDQPVNRVSAPEIARARGIEVEIQASPELRDYQDLLRVETGDVSLSGTALAGRPHLTELWGRSFNLTLTENMACFRYQDIPGMVGKLGEIFGRQAINIDAAAVGAGEPGSDAVMVLCLQEPASLEVIEEIRSLPEMHEGHGIHLAH